MGKQTRTVLVWIALAITLIPMAMHAYSPAESWMWGLRLFGVFLLVNVASRMYWVWEVRQETSPPEERAALKAMKAKPNPILSDTFIMPPESSPSGLVELYVKNHSTGQVDAWPMKDGQIERPWYAPFIPGCSFSTIDGDSWVVTTWDNIKRMYPEAVIRPGKSPAFCAFSRAGNWMVWDKELKNMPVALWPTARSANQSAVKG